MKNELSLGILAIQVEVRWINLNIHRSSDYLPVAQFTRGHSAFALVIHVVEIQYTARFTTGNKTTAISNFDKKQLTAVVL